MRNTHRSFFTSSAKFAADLARRRRSVDYNVIRMLIHVLPASQCAADIQDANYDTAWTTNPCLFPIAIVFSVMGIMTHFCMVMQILAIL